MSARVTRHFISLPGGRRVHYRRCGAGPVVMLLHGSPQWSGACVPFMDVLAKRGFCAIAPDTPGNGCSDPLPGETPTIDEYAHALGELVDGLGLGRISLYGFHTGAAIAATYAANNPARVASSVLEGLPAWTTQERALLLADYLPRFEPKWDGSHLAWLWARLEEQTIFFPWHTPSAAARMKYTDLSPADIDVNVTEFLRAGDNYRAPYHAAFVFRGEDVAPRLKGPALITARDGDPLLAHIARLPETVVGVTKMPLERDFFAALDRYMAFFGDNKGDLAPPIPAGDDGFTDLGASQLHRSGSTTGDGRPLILLHDPAGSSRFFAPVIDGLSAQRPSLAYDLPGFGESGDDFPGTIDTVEEFADVIEAAIRAEGFEAPAVAGFNLGGQIAIELKRRGVAGMAGIIGAPVFTEAERAERLALYTPSIAPDWDGGYLLRAWRFMRAMALFHPWYKRDAAHALPGEPRLDPAILHRRTVDLLKAGNRYQGSYAAFHSWDTAAGVAAAGEVTALRWAAYAQAGPETELALGLSNMVALPAPIAGWADALANWGR